MASPAAYHQSILSLTAGSRGRRSRPLNAAMDLDDLDGLSKPAPSRVSKFAPKGSKLKPQPPPPPPNPKPISFNRNAVEEETKPKIDAAPKPEVSLTSNGTDVKMKTDAPADPGPASPRDDPMDVEREEEEDMIVREIDVFFNPCVDPNTQLYVMQYPLRPCWRPYELDDRCEEVRVKPASNEVEIDLSINDSANWDADFAGRLKMAKQTLSSSWTPPRVAGYAIGLLIGDKLHLNPVHAMVQLRPSMAHFTTRRKNIVTSDVEAPVQSDGSMEVKPMGPPKKQHKSMELENEQKSGAQECWIPLKYHASKSDFSSRYLQKMVTQESSPADFTMKPYEYMNSLCPVSSKDSDAKGPSRRFLLALPVEERVKELLLKGSVQRFNALKHYVPDVSIEDFLALLNKYGQLVQGLWAPKSSLRFPNPEDQIKKMARDYILLLFTKNLAIKDSVIKNSQKVFPRKHMEDLKNFLNEFAAERPFLKDWKFKEAADELFISQYPKIVEMQGQSWKAVEEIFNKMFEQAGKSKPDIKNEKSGRPVNPLNKLNSEQSAMKSSSRVVTRKTLTDESRDTLRKVLPKVFQNHKVCSFQLIRQSLQDLLLYQSNIPKVDPKIVRAAASAVVDASPEELQEVIGEVATKVHGVYVLKSSPDHPEFDQLRKVVIDLFLARGLDAKLKKAEVFEAARLALKREMSMNEYNKVMNGLCESRASAWFLKCDDEKPSMLSNCDFDFSEEMADIYSAEEPYNDDSDMRYIQ